MEIKNIVITITEATEENGFFYDIYNSELSDIIDGETESLDGGFCTTTIENALDMATKQALTILKK